MQVRIARFILALLLALSIPVQSIAAVTAGICMATSHHDTGSDHDAHHAHDGAPHSHDRAADSHGSKGAHCPPCVACCAAASISGAVQVFVPDPAVMDALVEQWRSPPGYLPDGLYRPPL